MGIKVAIVVTDTYVVAPDDEVGATGVLAHDGMGDRLAGPA